MEKQFEANNLEELNPAADYICELAKMNSHFCFNAEIGAGKTTLINLICKKLGVKEHTSSPTYSIVNEYIDKENTGHFLDRRLNDISKISKFKKPLNNLKKLSSNFKKTKDILKIKSVFDIIKKLNQIKNSSFSKPF